MGNITHTTTHEAEALARLAEEFKNKDNLKALLNALTKQVQALEDVFWDLFTKRSIDTAEGVQLDVIGRILKQPRGTSPDDASYRLFLRARIRVLRSNGTPENVISVFVALMGAVGVVVYTPEFPAGFVIRLDGYSIDSDNATWGTNLTHWRLMPILKLLGQAKDAGVRALLEYSASTNDADMFFTARCGYQYGDHDVDSTSIVLRTGDPLFPTSGSVTFEPGTSKEETLEYTIIDKNYLGFGNLSRLILPVGLTYLHEDFAPVVLVGSKGKGFEHVAVSGMTRVLSGLGGKLAGVSEST